MPASALVMVIDLRRTGSSPGKGPENALKLRYQDAFQRRAHLACAVLALETERLLARHICALIALVSRI
jgi:hypothetical protein